MGELADMRGDFKGTQVLADFLANGVLPPLKEGQTSLERTRELQNFKRFCDIELATRRDAAAQEQLEQKLQQRKESAATTKVLTGKKWTKCPWSRRRRRWPSTRS
jgi:hypothetical protein